MSSQLHLRSLDGYPDIVLVKESHVQSHDDKFNTNNHSHLSPYQAFEDDSNNTVFDPKSCFSHVKPGSPVCDKCARVFPSFSILCTHQSRSCEEEKYVPCPEHAQRLVVIKFPQSQLSFTAPLLNEMGYKYELVGEPSCGTVECRVPAIKVTDVMHQIYATTTASYNLEQWYDALVKVDPGATARTLAIPLSDGELKLLQSLGMRYRFGDTQKSQADYDGLEALEEKISSALSQSPLQGKKLFARLSSRSPKDSTVVKERMTAAAQVVEGSDGGKQVVLEGLAKLKAQNEALRVEEAYEITELLIGSARVFIDITNYFKFRVPKTPTADMNLLLREYSDTLRHDLEFRCYVKDGRITAISQYFLYNAFDILGDPKTLCSIREAIIAFHDRVRSAFPWADYVFDVSLSERDISSDSDSTKSQEKKEEEGGSSSRWEVSVIEINPFGAWMSSGSGLFSWKDDYNTLYGLDGGKVEFRVLEK